VDDERKTAQDLVQGIDLEQTQYRIGLSQVTLQAQAPWAIFNFRFLSEKLLFNLLPPGDAVRKQKKNILGDLFSSVLSQFEKYHPSGNLKFDYLGIFQSSKLRDLIEKSSEFL